MDIDVVTETDAGGTTSYFLRHDFNTDTVIDCPGHGPYSSRAEAESAADLLKAAIACMSD